MTRIGIGIATIFLGVMTACAVESPSPADRVAPADPSATSENSSELLQSGSITPRVCLPFYMGAGNYFQCGSTEQWFTNRSRCIENCPEHSCSFDFICGSGGPCDCVGT